MKKIQTLSWTVILLTSPLLSHCSSLSTLRNPFSVDPVTRSAQAQRNTVNPETEMDHLGENPLETLKIRHELRIGMNMNEVISILGKPQEIQVAGNPELGNQKWTYWEGVNDTLLNKPRSVVYFEEGEVAGWENLPLRRSEN